ncbi:MAG: S24/S26 family peptidase [Proteiniphilum sp.]|jgi:hypothetical protein|nr:S24/S26 family peptidase [Proteiniphilum sp.]NCB24944.1 hypothetical protein [Bacteroidia bacterium]MDD2938006.1 S24/S26 family peptidase [Proteiniphilum sp.]MDD3075037.1 S24/S26 family peptidase [Proteiniphilum sp.]MDD3955379.1 S24/S26 family peptidase [Proteiniphilum sp.]
MKEDRHKVIPNELLFDEVAKQIALGYRVQIRAKGNSMLPFIREGKDCIMLEKVGAYSFQSGNLLLVHLRDGRYVLHRVMKCDEDQIVLRGDGNLSAVETCTRDEVIAEAVQVIRSGKAICRGSLLWNMYRSIWPGGTFFRRIGLAIYRRLRFR